MKWIKLLFLSVAFSLAFLFIGTAKNEAEARCPRCGGNHGYMQPYWKQGGVNWAPWNWGRQVKLKRRFLYVPPKRPGMHQPGRWQWQPGQYQFQPGQYQFQPQQGALQ